MSTIAATIARTAKAHSTTRTSDFIAACPQARPHSVRARLHYMVGAGVLSRVAKGMYVAASGGCMQVGFQADSTVACAELAAAGCKVDAVFLDVPYGAADEGQGVKGGNRDIASFPVMHSSDFRPMASDLSRMMSSDDAPAVLIMSNGKSSQKARTGYIAAMESAGFHLVAVGTYTKTYANGKPVQFMGRTMPTEGIFVFNKSGKAIDASLEVSAVRPGENAYPTQKAEALLDAIVSRLSCAGDLWLDPFAGSGSLAVTNRKLGRSGIYIDIMHNPAMKALA